MSIPEITPQEVNEKNSNYVLIDVRNPEEYTGELGHVEGAELKTLGDELSNWLKENQSTYKDKEVVFICRSGGRSGKATEEAVQLGYTKPYNMQGGMIKWNELELPVLK